MRCEQASWHWPAPQARAHAARAAGDQSWACIGLPQTRRNHRSARHSRPGIYLCQPPRLRSSLPSASPIVAGALCELCKAHGKGLGLPRIVLLELRVMVCGRHGVGAAERDAVSPRVVIACRLRCLDHPVVDTGAEFESPSGAPLGYDRGSLVGEVLPGPAEPRAPAERTTYGGERVAQRVARVRVARMTSARARSLLGPCAACAWSSAVIPGVADAYARVRVWCRAARCWRRSRWRSRSRDVRSLLGARTQPAGTDGRVCEAGVSCEVLLTLFRCMACLEWVLGPLWSA